MRLVWTRHGAGDRAVGFVADVKRFDHVLLAGDKIERRLLERGLIRPGDYCNQVYAKFDWAGPRDERTRLFDNDRPTILYNPHFRTALSSWSQWGRQILDHFAAQDRYNLIFAPHVRLFDPLRRGDLKRFEQYRNLPHLHLDLGSERSIDMSYPCVADMYPGDVSSQVAEFLYRPRPCVFLNAHGIDWKDKPDYRFWSLGPVVQGLDELGAKIEQSFATHESFRAEQQRYFQDSFGIEPGVRTAVRGADAIARMLRRESREQQASLPPTSGSTKNTFV